MKEGERLTFVLASTLDLSGKPDDGTYKPLGDEVIGELVPSVLRMRARGIRSHELLRL